MKAKPFLLSKIMAQGKKSFQLYTEWIEIFLELDDEDAGQLIKHIFEYVNDTNPTTKNKMVSLSFIQIKQQLKRDLKKWENIRDRNISNGANGGRPKNPNNPVGILGNPNKPKKPVEVEVKVKVEDKVKAKEENKQKKVYTKDVHTCLHNCLKFFPKQLHPNEIHIKNWLDTIDKLNRIDELPFNIIEGVVKKTRDDDFWKNNFLAIPKLRKKDKNGVMYILVFNESIKNGQQDKFSEEAVKQRLADGVEYFTNRFNE